MDIKLQPELFILSNHMKEQGAICLLYDGILDQIWKFLKEDYYIIPSSIHETLIVRASEADVDKLNEIFRKSTILQYPRKRYFLTMLIFMLVNVRNCCVPDS